MAKTGLWASTGWLSGGAWRGSERQISLLATRRSSLRASLSLGCCGRSGGARQGNDADVVLLAEDLDGVGNFRGTVAALHEFLHTGEAEELAFGVHRLG